MNQIRCRNNFGEEVELPMEKFYFRPSAYGFIIQDKNVLVLRNKSNGKIWFPGGGVEIGEKLEDGLMREIREETGLAVKIEKFVFFKENFFYYQPFDEAYHAFLFFYQCRPLGGELLRDEDVDDIESEKPRWVAISSISREEISDLSEEIYLALCQLIS